MTHVESEVLNQFVQILSSAFMKASAEAVTPAISRADLPLVGSYHWYRVRFDQVPQLQIFAGVPKGLGEAAETEVAETVSRLSEISSILAEYVSNAVGCNTIASVADVDGGPEATPVSLQVQSGNGISELIFSLDTATINWFAAQTIKKEQKSTHMSMMDTLMDVELPVSILLARREASLSDVLQWGPGAIVEFEAGLGDPVEVIVNEQTVARGSVVLVDGNYGVRVTEVLTAGPAATGTR